MITIFCIPRPFNKTVFRVIQSQAFLSWQQLRPQPEILAFIDSASAGLWLRHHHIPCLSVSRDKDGVPLVSSAIEQAKRLARYDTLCMANADNLYLDDFMPAVRRLRGAFPVFLAMGRRYCLEVGELYMMSEGRAWQTYLRGRIAEELDPLHHYRAMDYLIWRGDFWGEIPHFAVGRMCYDNWLVWKALQADIPVVDITQAVTIIHQDHPPPRRTKVFAAQAKRNEKLFVADGATHTTTQQATYEMTEDGKIVRR